jgi:SAM-dependent methyltransferase
MSGKPVIKNFIPDGVRRFLRRDPDSLPTEPNDAELWERSRLRWRAAEPVGHLTWGVEINGDAFVTKLKSYDAFGSDKALLEIGPGYGRLLRSIIAQQIGFKNYLGIDLSKKNVAYLAERFGAANVQFQHGDIEQLEIAGSFDVLFSSLTFKHLFPTFENALANATKALNGGALIFFDLIDGTGECFEQDGRTYVRHYTRDDVAGILGRVGLKLVNWDEVSHTPQHSRLLVVATKPK